jgi:hypothetical protein
MTVWSIISSVAGTSPAAMMAETAAPAASSESERNHHRLDRRRVADQPHVGRV